MNINNQPGQLSTNNALNRSVGSVLTHSGGVSATAGKQAGQIVDRLIQQQQAESTVLLAKHQPGATEELYSKKIEPNTKAYRSHNDAAQHQVNVASNYVRQQALALFETVKPSASETLGIDLVGVDTYA